MTRWIASLLVSAVLPPVLLATETVEKVERMDDRALVALTRSARTAAEHLRVARQYDLRAEAFEKKAAHHEREASKLASRRASNPMSEKWPALVQAPIERHRGLAMQARRAAKEARELSAKHSELAGKSPVVAVE